MTLTDLQKEIYSINRANGWHDKAPSKLEQHALFHTEITEACNEFIAGRLETWYQEDGKPEGFYTELADVVIRILDYFSLCNFNVSGFQAENTPILCDNVNSFQLLLELHSKVSIATELIRDGKPPSREFIFLYFVILDINEYLELYNQSLTDLITEKIAYNKTRGFRHGNKQI